VMLWIQWTVEVHDVDPQLLDVVALTACG
jgi:hypothetical protein